MKITDKIHLLKLDFTINLSPDKKIERFVNCLIIFGNNITLVDTGTKGSEEKIFNYVKANNRNIEDITTIVLSHSHPDHIGSAAEIKKKTLCRILAHEGEKNWIENIEMQAKERPVPGFFNMVDQSVKIDKILKHNDKIKVDEDVTLEIIHSPGHSKGSINIFFKENKILFTADSVPIMNDIPNYDNFNELMNSLDMIRENKAYKILLSSWAAPITDEYEINKFLNEGEKYVRKLNESVSNIYVGEEKGQLEFCRRTILKLGLPEFYINPVVDKAFKSHLG
jgi:glyoxylase-like metal-dependent hydrolase (beta-lactamase superfamily II)